MTNLTQSLKVILLAIVLSFGISYVFAWTPPTVAPPDGNSMAPLNTNAGIQTKAGTLVFNRNDGVQGLETYGTTLLATGFNGLGLVGIGTASPWAKLTIENTNNPNVIPDLAVGNIDFASSDIAFTNGLTSVEAKISTEGGGGDTDFRIATKSNGGFDPGTEGTLVDRFVVDWDGTVGINTSFPTEALTVGGVIETKAGPGGTSGIKFADGTTQTTASNGGGIISQATGWSKWTIMYLHVSGQTQITCVSSSGTGVCTNFGTVDYPSCSDGNPMFTVLESTTTHGGTWSDWTYKGYCVPLGSL